jgi:hypothetical protein
MTPAQDPQPQVVMIDQSTIYNLLLEVRDDVRDVKKDVAEIRADSADHEARIRDLEQRKFISPWQLWTVFGGGVTVIGAVVALLRGLGVG